MVDYTALDAHILGAISKTTDDQQHIRDAMASDSERLRASAAANVHAPSDLLAHALADESFMVRRAAAWNRALTTELIDDAFHAQPGIRELLVQHRNASVSVIEAAVVDSRDPRVQLEALRHPHATAEILGHAIDDRDDRVRAAAVNHPNTTPAIVAKAAADPSMSVRLAAMKTELADDQVLWKGIRDDDWSVRSAAAAHPRASAAMLEIAADDSSSYVRANAAVHSNTSSAARTRAMVDDDHRAPTLRRQARNAQRHKHFVPDGVRRYEGDPQVTYQDALQTQLADRARRLSADEILAASIRLEGIVAQADRHPFSTGSNLMLGLWREANEAHGPQRLNQQSGPEFVLVAESHFNMIDAELSERVLTALERAPQDAPSPPYLRELLQRGSSDLETLFESASVIADVLVGQAADPARSDAQRLADINSRRHRSSRLQGAEPDGVLDQLPVLDAELWPDDTPSGRRRQTLYAMQVVLSYRVVVVNNALLNPKR